MRGLTRAGLVVGLLLVAGCGNAAVAAQPQTTPEATAIISPTEVPTAAPTPTFDTAPTTLPALAATVAPADAVPRTTQGPAAIPQPGAPNSDVAASNADAS